MILKSVFLHTHKAVLPTNLQEIQQTFQLTGCLLFLGASCEKHLFLLPHDVEGTVHVRHFSAKGHIVNTLGFVGQMVNHNLSVLHCSPTAVTQESSNKILFTVTGSGPK